MSLVYCPRCGCAMPVSWGAAQEVVGQCCTVCGCEEINEVQVRAFDRAPLNGAPDQRADQPLL